MCLRNKPILSGEGSSLAQMRLACLAGKDASAGKSSTVSHALRTCEPYLTMYAEAARTGRHELSAAMRDSREARPRRGGCSAAARDPLS
eukprot:6210049-Pleurochrysis_carterae.AAC.4